jgi:hypothetical protein
MDRHQAKEILARYRPGETFGDPQVGEALELARRDQQLGEWFARQRAAQVGGIALPAEISPAKTERQRNNSTAAFILIGIAALLLIAVFTWSFTVPKTRDPFTTYRERMARVVRRAYPVQVAFNDLTPIREYFRTNGGPVDFPLPRNLEKLPPKGCAVFTWRNYPVALMSFDAGGNTNLSLFLIPRASFPDTPVPIVPDYVRVGKLLTASWTQGNRIYVLAGPDDPALLKNYIE